MGTIAEKLEYLNGTKDAIKTAIEGKGVTVPDGTTFRGYAAMISSMPSGGIYQEKSVTPTGEQFDVLPDAGYDALSKVTVAGDSALKPWNIPEGTTIYGVVGTAKLAVTADPPADLPVSKDDADTVLTENDATADVSTFDLMVLAQDDGNITYGYLSKGSGKVSYNGVELPAMPDWDKTTYPYGYIVHRTATDQYMFVASSTIAYSTTSYFLNLPRPSITSILANELWGEFSVNELTTTTEDNFGSSWGSLIWCNNDLTYKDGTVYLAASDPVPSGAFTITSYDPITTEFKAKGWRRLSYHTTGELAGTWTYDDFTDTESGGWNYLKNVRSCSREKLYYNGVEVWPNNQYMAGMYRYNGTYLPGIPIDDKNNYEYAVITYDTEYFLFLTNIQPHYDEPYTMFDGTVLTYQYKDGKWAYPNQFDNYPFQNNIHVGGTSFTLWSNKDIPSYDGTIYLEGSEPIKV